MAQRNRLPAAVGAMALLLGGCATGGAMSEPARLAQPVAYDVLIRNGMIYDGKGGVPFAGEVGIRDGRIAYVGPAREAPATKVVDAQGLAVSPGFINMLSWANESLLVDGRGQ